MKAIKVVIKVILEKKKKPAALRKIVIIMLRNFEQQSILHVIRPQLELDLLPPQLERPLHMQMQMQMQLELFQVVQDERITNDILTELQYEE